MECCRRKAHGNSSLYTGTTSVQSAVYSKDGSTLYTIATGSVGPVQVFSSSQRSLLGYLNFGLANTAISPDGESAATSAFYLGINMFKVPKLVTAPLRALKLSQTTVGQLNSITATVSLLAPAPAGGLDVGIATAPSIDGYLQAPSTVTIPAGATSASFTVVINYVLQSTECFITAYSGPYAATASLTVTPSKLAFRKTPREAALSFDRWADFGSCLPRVRRAPLAKVS